MICQLILASLGILGSVGMDHSTTGAEASEVSDTQPDETGMRWGLEFEMTFLEASRLFRVIDFEKLSPEARRTIILNIPNRPNRPNGPKNYIQSQGEGAYNLSDNKAEFALDHYLEENPGAWKLLPSEAKEELSKGLALDARIHFAGSRDGSGNLLIPSGLTHEKPLTPSPILGMGAGNEVASRPLIEGAGGQIEAKRESPLNPKTNIANQKIDFEKSGDLYLPSNPRAQIDWPIVLKRWRELPRETKRRWVSLDGLPYERLASGIRAYLLGQDGSTISFPIKASAGDRVNDLFSRVGWGLDQGEVFEFRYKTDALVFDRKKVVQDARLLADLAHFSPADFELLPVQVHGSAKDQKSAGALVHALNFLFVSRFVENKRGNPEGMDRLFSHYRNSYDSVSQKGLLRWVDRGARFELREFPWGLDETLKKVENWALNPDQLHAELNRTIQHLPEDFYHHFTNQVDSEDGIDQRVIRNLINSIFTLSSQGMIDHESGERLINLSLHSKSYHGKFIPWEPAYRKALALILRTPVELNSVSEKEFREIQTLLVDWANNDVAMTWPPDGPIPRGATSGDSVDGGFRRKFLTKLLQVEFDLIAAHGAKAGPVVALGAPQVSTIVGRFESAEVSVKHALNEILPKRWEALPPEIKRTLLKSAEFNSGLIEKPLIEAWKKDLSVLEKIPTERALAKKLSVAISRAEQALLSAAKYGACPGVPGESPHFLGRVLQRIVGRK